MCVYVCVYVCASTCVREFEQKSVLKRQPKQSAYAVHSPWGAPSPLLFSCWVVSEAQAPDQPSLAVKKNKTKSSIHQLCTAIYKWICRCSWTISYAIVCCHGYPLYTDQKQVDKPRGIEPGFWCVILNPIYSTFSSYECASALTYTRLVLISRWWRIARFLLDKVPSYGWMGVGWPRDRSKNVNDLEDDLVGVAWTTKLVIVLGVWLNCLVLCTCLGDNVP